MPKTIKTTVLRDNLSEALSQAKDDNILVVTKNNRPVNAIVDIDYLEDLLMLSNPKFMKTLEEARDDIKHGRLYTHEEVFGDLS